MPASLPVIFTIIFLSLAGCAAKPAADTYIPAATAPPPRTSEAEKPVPAPLDGPLSLERAIQSALANNPEIAATQWDVAVGEARLDVARAARRPTLSAEGDYQYSLDNQRLIQARYNGEPGTFDHDLYRSDLVLTLPLYTGGRLSHEIDAALLLKSSEEFRLGRTREELVYNVTSTFFTILGQQEVIRSLEFSVSAMEEHLHRIKDLLAAQKAARIDLLRTEVRLADLRQSLVKEQNILTLENRLLATLLGTENSPERFDLEGSLDFQDDAIPPQQEILETVFLRRGDYLAAKARMEAQSRRVAIASAGHWPTVSLTGSYGARASGTGDSEDVGTVGVGVTMPLFEGGRTTAQVNQERAALAAARERLRKLELQIRLEVETALLDIRSSSERIQASRQAIDQARESLRIEQMKYALASGSMTDVLDVQAALLQAETTYARALADFHIACARLKLASGENLS